MITPIVCLTDTGCYTRAGSFSINLVSSLCEWNTQSARTLLLLLLECDAVGWTQFVVKYVLLLEGNPSVCLSIKLKRTAPILARWSDRFQIQIDSAPLLVFPLLATTQIAWLLITDLRKYCREWSSQSAKCQAKCFLLSIDYRSRIVSSLRDCWSCQFTKLELPIRETPAPYASLCARQQDQFQIQIHNPHLYLLVDQISFKFKIRIAPLRYPLWLFQIQIQICTSCDLSTLSSFSSLNGISWVLKWLWQSIQNCLTIKCGRVRNCLSIDIAIKRCLSIDIAIDQSLLEYWYRAWLLIFATLLFSFNDWSKIDWLNICDAQRS